MRAAIRECESHQERFDAQDAAELRDNRNAAAFADERGLAIERFTQRALSRFAECRVRIGEIPRSTVAGSDLHRDTFGEMLSQMLLCELENLVAFLLRNETKRQFCHRMTGDHRLSPLPLITAADSVDLGSRPRPDALQRIVPRFAEKLR